MTAEEALDTYKGRDASEKLFRGDKSYLGNKSFRVHTTESVRAKIFIEFIALIIRNRMHTYLREQMLKNGKKQNYMTVPAAIRELEKIEMIRLSNRDYRLDYSVTATQKEILKAFNITAVNIKTQSVEINHTLTSAGERGSIMAGKSIPIEEKIARQKEVVSRAKDRYDEAVADLEELMKKRDEIKNKELIEAYIASGRSFEEVMKFLTSTDEE